MTPLGFQSRSPRSVFRSSALDRSMAGPLCCIMLPVPASRPPTRRTCRWSAQMISRQVFFERELIEQRSLSTCRCPIMIRKSCLSQQPNQRNQPAQLTDFFDRNGPFRYSPLRGTRSRSEAKRTCPRYPRTVEIERSTEHCGGSLTKTRRRRF